MLNGSFGTAWVADRQSVREIVEELPAPMTPPARYSFSNSVDWSLPICPSAFLATAVFALATYLRTPKIARTARIPTIATTIISSISVNARFNFLIKAHLLQRDATRTFFGRHRHSRRVVAQRLALAPLTTYECRTLFRGPGVVDYPRIELTPRGSVPSSSAR